VDMSGLSLLQRSDGSIVVDSVAEDGPAAAAGVRDGDLLLAVDGRAASALTLEAIRRLLREEGASRRLSLSRGGQPVELAVRLRRRL